MEGFYFRKIFISRTFSSGLFLVPKFRTLFPKTFFHWSFMVVTKPNSIMTVTKPNSVMGVTKPNSIWRLPSRTALWWLPSGPALWRLSSRTAFGDYQANSIMVVIKPNSIWRLPSRTALWWLPSETALLRLFQFLPKIKYISYVKKLELFTYRVSQNMEIQWRIRYRLCYELAL